MKLFNWAEAFEERRIYQDIPAKVRRTETGYWLFMPLTIVVTVAGLVFMMTSPSNDLKRMLLGLFVAVDGVVACALVKIWAHIRLAQYWIIWDSQNRLEAEINKSLAEDL
jgi:predicted exporter